MEIKKYLGQVFLRDVREVRKRDGGADDSDEERALGGGDEVQVLECHGVEHGKVLEHEGAGGEELWPG